MRLLLQVGILFLAALQLMAVVAAILTMMEVSLDQVVLAVAEVVEEALLLVLVVMAIPHQPHQAKEIMVEIRHYRLQFLVVVAVVVLLLLAKQEVVQRVVTAEMVQFLLFLVHLLRMLAAVVEVQIMAEQD
jgi:hypothetical protein